MRIFLIVSFLTLTLTAVFMLNAPVFVYANHDPTHKVDDKYTVEIPIPGAPTQELGLIEYIKYLYVFALGIVGLTAFGAMVYGGIVYMSSAGNPSLQTEAKDRITNALLGLGLLLISWLILNTINPDLVNLTAPKLTPAKIEKLGLERYSDPGGTPLGGCVDDGQCNSGFFCQGYIPGRTGGTCISTNIADRPGTQKCNFSGGTNEAIKAACVANSQYCTWIEYPPGSRIPNTCAEKK